MGWLFGWYERKDLIEHLVNGNGLKTIKHCFCGNNLWAVQEGTRQDGTTIRFIALYLLKGSPRVHDDPHNWGYKYIDESMGPCEQTCPISYIEMVEAHEKEHGYGPQSDAAEWRQKVRERCAKLNSVKPGMILQYGSFVYTVVKRVGRRFLVDSSNGQRYSMKTRHVLAAEIKQP